MHLVVSEMQLLRTAKTSGRYRLLFAIETKAQTSPDHSWSRCTWR